MLSQKKRFVSSLLAGALAVGLTISHFSAEAQAPAADHQATSEMVNQHTHSMVITDAHLKELISSTGDTDTVTLQTSQEYNGSPKDGALHSHQVKMNKQQMQVLDAAGEVDVETDEAAGHKHYMRFYKPAQCPTTYPQPYPPQACPYGGKCQYPYPYPQVGCPPPCTTCQYPYPYPTYCPTCPTPKPCATCPPLPPPTYTSPVPTTTAAPSPTATASPSGAPSPTPGASASPGATPSSSLLGPTFNCDRPEGQINVPGSECYCTDHPSEQICEVICSVPGSKCYCFNFNARDNRCNYPPLYTSTICTPGVTVPACSYASPRPVPRPDVESAVNAGLPIPSGTPEATSSPVAIAGASPGVSASPAASATPTVTPSVSPTSTRTPTPTPTQSPSRAPSPTQTPTSLCDTPGTNCYCGIQGPSDPNCSVSCSTPGSNCYCNFIDPTHQSCPGAESGFTRLRSK